MFDWLKKTPPAPQKAPSATLPTAAANGPAAQANQADESAACKDRGDKHLAEGKLEDAAECYRQALSINPNNAEACCSLGMLFLQQDLYGDAERYLGQAVLIGPEMAKAYYFLGIALQKQGKLNEAIKNYNKALELKPGAEIIYRDLCYALFQSGQNETARQVIAKGVALNPGFADFHSFLGNLYCHEKEFDKAVACYQKALMVQPDSAEVNSNLGKAFQEQGKLDEAIACYRNALEIQPGYANAHYDLGRVFQNQGAWNEAMDCYRKALAIKPDFAEAYVTLGSILKEQGKADEAMMCYCKGLELQPDLVEAHNNLGGLFKDHGKLNEAIACYQKALAIKPDSADVYCNLGLVSKGYGKFSEAIAYYQKALELKPDFVDAHFNLGNAFFEQGKQNEAIACYRKALAIKPDFADAHSNLGNVLQRIGQPDDAMASYHRALEIKSDHAEAHLNLGVALQELGQLDDAIVYFRRALEIKHDYAEAHNNLIFTLDLSDTVGLSELHVERKKWDEAHAAPLWQGPIHSNDRSPTRRLRIGYVSADFRGHSAAKVFGGMLTRYDRSQFDVFAYSNLKGKADRFTDLFQQSVTVWRNIGSLPDDAVAKMIREDRIDILVDLSGHTSGNRLLVFARKPAPIQITAWGYATGTGMRAMDVFFADPVMVPPEDKQYFTEEVRYLPSVVGAFFNEPFPDVNELPALSDGVITFGSLNRLAKLTDKTYRAWAEVLLAIPWSRLILKTPELNDASTRERVVGHFTKAGVVADRIIMQGGTQWSEHVRTYHQIDIALDPFPHGGGVTTLEGLMMGVPIITLRWPTVAGKLSASIMTTMGLPDWIAETQKEYVGLAIRKTKDLQSMAALRQQLRGIFTSSVMGDPVAYARAVEQEYRQLWQRWCTNCSASNNSLVAVNMPQWGK